MSDNSRTTRRSVLRASTAIGLASVAGCLGGSGPSEDTGNNESGSTVSTTPATPGPFKEITTASSAIAITLRDGTNVDKINVISPKGTVYAEKRVSQGVTSVEIPIERGYVPGKQEILAIDTNKDETIAQSSVTLQPALSIETSGWVYSLPEGKESGRWGMGDPQPRYDLYFDVTNTGNSPGFINGYVTSGSPPQKLNTVDGTMMAASKPRKYKIDWERPHYIIIPPEKTVRVYTTGAPLEFVDTKQKKNCTVDTTQSAQFTITISHTTGDNLQESFEYTYKKALFEGQRQWNKHCRVMEINAISGE